MGDKRLKLHLKDLRPLVTEEMGGCIASDRITVDGAPVGYLERIKTTRDDDSGWLFTAGDEPAGFLRDSKNLGVYHLNYVANCDPRILPFIWALPGQRFQFDAKAGRFVEARGSKRLRGALKMPEGWSVEGPGRVTIGKRWSIDVGSPFRRRLDDGSHVLWRPNFTIWLSDEPQAAAGTKERQLEVLQQELSGREQVFDVARADLTARLGCVTFRGRKTSEGAESLNAVVVAAKARLRFGVYFDDVRALEEAQAIVRSTRFT